MRVYDTETKVILNNGCAGIIIGINIAGKVKDITYKIAWWNEEAHNTAWVAECEFTTEAKKSLSIGFT